MYGMSIFLVLALLAIAVLAKENFSFSSQDYDVLESSGQTAMVQHSPLSSSTAPSNESAKTLLPEFVTVLFKCWGRREDNARYRECLESMGEGEKAAEIMTANSVTAFIGVCECNTICLHVHAIESYMHSPSVCQSAYLVTVSFDF